MLWDEELQIYQGTASSASDSKQVEIFTKETLKIGDWRALDAVHVGQQSINTNQIPPWFTEMNPEANSSAVEIQLLPLIVSGPDFSTALPILLQGYGVGPLKGNVILSNWYGETMTSFPGLIAMKFGHNLRIAFRKGYNLVVFHINPLRSSHIDDPKKKDRIIDVWWSNDASSRLMLLLAYLMTRTELWANASIRLLTVEENTDHSKSIEQLEQQLDDVRISAEPLLVSDTSPETVVAESSSSTIVFLPFRIQRSMLTDSKGYSLERVLTHLPPTAMVMAAKDIDLDAEPEEGGAGELAQALDNLHDVEKRAAKVEKQHKKYQQQVTTLEEKLDKKSASLDETARKGLNEQLTEAKETAEKSFRKAAKEQAKLDDALTLVKQLGEDDV